MSTERNSDSIGLASYLSPSDIQKAVRLTKKIKSIKRIEDALRYQKQLAFLMAKAERNKKLRERMIRRQAMELKKLDKEQIRERIKERYFNSSVKPVDAVMVDEESGDFIVLEAKAVEKTSRTVTRHYQILDDAAAAGKVSAVEVKPVADKKIPRHFKHFKLKSHSGNEKSD